MLRNPGLQPGDENEVPSFSWAYFFFQPLSSYDKNNISFAARHDDAVMSPAQLRPQRGRNFGVGFIKLAHPFQIAPFKTFDAGFFSLNEVGELLDSFFAPVRGLQSIVDVLANAPIQLDQLLVTGDDDVVLGVFNEVKNLDELRL
jgi:hypothetical protein